MAWEEPGDLGRSSSAWRIAGGWSGSPPRSTRCTIWRPHPSRGEARAVPRPLARPRRSGLRWTRML